MSVDKDSSVLRSVRFTELSPDFCRWLAAQSLLTRRHHLGAEQRRVSVLRGPQADSLSNGVPMKHSFAQAATAGWPVLSGSQAK